MDTVFPEQTEQQLFFDVESLESDFCEEINYYRWNSENIDSRIVNVAKVACAGERLIQHYAAVNNLDYDTFIAYLAFEMNRKDDDDADCG